jgi:hypothetical protein
LTVSKVKRRLFSEQLDELIVWLETSDSDQPKLFGSRDEYEWLLRLAAVVGSLVARHALDDQGRCQWCAHPRRGWRRLLPRWPRRESCRVLDAAEFFTQSDVGIVWWQVFARRGDKITLEDVRAWLRPDQPDDQPADEPHEQPVENSDGRHALLSDRKCQG